MLISVSTAIGGGNSCWERECSRCRTIEVLVSARSRVPMELQQGKCEFRTVHEVLWEFTMTSGLQRTQVIAFRRGGLMVRDAPSIINRAAG